MYDFLPVLIFRFFFFCNKGRSLKFREGSRVRQTPEEGRRTYRPKCCENNNKDEDDSPKILNDKNQQALSQKFIQLSFVVSTFNTSFPNRRGCPRGVMVKAMDFEIVVYEFKLQSRYYVRFRANTLGKGMNPLILPAMG